MPKYRKKPVVVEAVQWMGNYQDLQELTNEECNHWCIDHDKGQVSRNRNTWHYKNTKRKGKYGSDYTISWGF